MSAPRKLHECIRAVYPVVRGVLAEEYPDCFFPAAYDDLTADQRSHLDALAHRALAAEGFEPPASINHRRALATEGR